MSSPFISIFGRSLPDNFIEPLKNFLLSLLERKIPFAIFEPILCELRQHVPDFTFPTFINHDTIPEQTSLLLSIGGDGTMLETLTLVRDKNIPILGVNTGRLGFLSEIFPEDLPKALEKFLKKEFTIQPRNVLEIHSPSIPIPTYPFALNDFTIKKSDHDTLSRITVSVDGEFLNTYWADGLIISTATGSTAYNLSVGGPILTPCGRQLIISPIASHNLTVRPIIIPEQSIIKISVEKRPFPHVGTLDNRNILIRDQIDFIVRSATFTFNIVQLQGNSFFQTLRSKLMWGVDKRN